MDLRFYSSPASHGKAPCDTTFEIQDRRKTNAITINQMWKLHTIYIYMV